MRSGRNREKGGTHADELIEEDTAEVGTGGDVDREHAGRATGGEHDGIELSGCRKGRGDFLW